MGFRMGIVGLPNVGKSTLFNALTRTAAAQAANFPFCTIEPNVGEVAVPDDRLEKLAAIAGSKQIIPTRMTFVDIAGLVRGASKGEGLGNQFLANIRECDAIAHVLRCFEDGDITHVEGRIDPIADAETIETELMLADLESIERRRANLSRKMKGGDKEAADQDRLLAAAQAVLEQGKPARTVAVSEDDQRNWRLLQLLTAKPVLFVCNVEESSAASGNSQSARVAEMAAKQGAASVVISARIEEEISQLDAEEAAMFLEEMGLHEAGLDRLIKAGYALLGLADLLHRRAQGGAGLDDHQGHPGTASGRRDPWRFREGFHPRRDHRLSRLHRRQGRGGGEGSRKVPGRGQDLRGAGRRRAALPVLGLREDARPVLGSMRQALGS